MFADIGKGTVFPLCIIIYTKGQKIPYAEKMNPYLRFFLNGDYFL